VSRIAVYTGSFDPLTLGHVDIIRRAARLCDRLVIGLTTNSTKAPLFTVAERLEMVSDEAAAISSQIEVHAFDGLAVHFAQSVGARFIVRGLRSGTDFDYEKPMAAMNASMAPEIDTIFLMAAPACGHIASSLVKDVARGGGEVGHFVPSSVAAAIARRPH
jgi:pantetheine-phosphate adenylyltransferase